MGHSDRHRGKQPKDDELFSDAVLPILREALDDYCLLLTKDYPPTASLKLVGDKFELTTRQRNLLMRSSCSDSERVSREAKVLLPDALKGEVVFVDGFNLLIAVESALSGGFVFVGRDGCFRDLSSIHGSYKRVAETQEAILLVGQALSQLAVGRVQWFSDKPVSNSGRLKSLVLELAAEHAWDWHVDLLFSPDAELKARNGITITTDAVILDAVDAWFNLNAFIVEMYVPKANLLDLR